MKAYRLLVFLVVFLALLPSTVFAGDPVPVDADLLFCHDVTTNTPRSTQSGQTLSSSKPNHLQTFTVDNPTALRYISTANAKTTGTGSLNFTMTVYEINDNWPTGVLSTYPAGTLLGTSTTKSLSQGAGANQVPVSSSYVDDFECEDGSDNDGFLVWEFTPPIVLQPGRYAFQINWLGTGGGSWTALHWLHNDDNISGSDHIEGEGKYIYFAGSWDGLPPVGEADAYYGLFGTEYLPPPAHWFIRLRNAFNFFDTFGNVLWLVGVTLLVSFFFIAVGTPPHVIASIALLLVGGYVVLVLVPPEILLTILAVGGFLGILALLAKGKGGD